MTRDVFIPAAWMTAHGFTYEHLGPACDLLLDESNGSEEAVRLLVDCAKQATYDVAKHSTHDMPFALLFSDMWFGDVDPPKLVPSGTFVPGNAPAKQLRSLYKSILSGV